MRPLVLVADTYPALSQTFTRREARDLLAEGLPVSIVALHAPGPRDPALEPGADPCVTYLPPPGSRAVLGALARALVRRPSRVASLLSWTLRPQARPVRWGFQVRAPVHLAWACWLAERLPANAHVHAQFCGSASTVAWMASRLAGTSFSFRVHAEWTFAIGARKLADASLVLAISEHERARLLAACAGRDATAGARVVVSRLGVDLAAWPPRPEPALDGPLRIVSVGMLGATKGHDVLLEALALLRDRGVAATLAIVGEGPERPRLERIVRERGLGGIATLHGALRPAEVRALTADAHVAALACRVTATGDFDGIPIALMEAMATARPVVTCSVSALPELVEDGSTGLLVPPERPDLLAAALERLAGDAALRGRLGAAARRRVEADYDARDARARAARLFREILGAVRPTP